MEWIKLLLNVHQQQPASECNSNTRFWCPCIIIHEISFGTKHVHYFRYWKTISEFWHEINHHINAISPILFKYVTTKIFNFLEYRSSKTCSSVTFRQQLHIFFLYFLGLFFLRLLSLRNRIWCILIQISSYFIKSSYYVIYNWNLIHFNSYK